MSNRLRVVDGLNKGSWREPEASAPRGVNRWGGFIALDFHSKDRISPSLRRQADAVITNALGGRQNFFTSFDGTIMRASVGLPDQSQQSREVLGTVVDRLCEALPDATVLDTRIEYSDPDSIQVTRTPDGLQVSFRPTLVRED